MTIRSFVASTCVLFLFVITSCSEDKQVVNYKPLKLVGNEYVLDRDLVTKEHFDKVQELLDSRKVSFDRKSLVHIKLHVPIDIELSLEITQAAELITTKSKGISVFDTRISGGSHQKALDLAQRGKHRKALEIILPIAKTGDMDAAFVAAEIYTLQKNMAEAINWHKVAAEGRYFPSMISLHSLYLADKDGVPKDTDEAMMWLEKAAVESGDRMLQEQVYFNYIGGNAHIPANEERAEYWRNKLRGQM